MHMCPLSREFGFGGSWRQVLVRVLGIKLVSLTEVVSRPSTVAEGKPEFSLCLQKDRYETLSWLEKVSSLLTVQNTVRTICCEDPRVSQHILHKFLLALYLPTLLEMHVTASLVNSDKLFTVIFGILL